LDQALKIAIGQYQKNLVWRCISTSNKTLTYLTHQQTSGTMGSLSLPFDVSSPPYNQSAASTTVIKLSKQARHIQNAAISHQVTGFLLLSLDCMQNEE
jgi:hypothetical protein